MTGCAMETHGDDCPDCGGRGYTTAIGPQAAEARACSRLLACPLCRGRGVREVRDQGGRVGQAPCPLLALLHRVGLFCRAGVPARHHDATAHSLVPADSSQRQAKGLFIELCDGFTPGQRGVGLAGEPGVGKTHLLASLARYLTLERGIEVRYAEFSQLLWSLKAGYAAGRPESELVRPLATVPVLFIDEMGKGRGSEWELDVLDQIISERYNRRLSTFFATNFAVEGPGTRAASPAGSFADPAELRRRSGETALEERVDARIWSRLAEMCELRTLRGPDHRRRSSPPLPGGTRRDRGAR